MTITQKITLDMSDLAEMLTDKIGTGYVDPKNIVINDYISPEPLEDTEGVGEQKNVKTSDLFKKSNILKVLKEGLEAAGAGNKYPKNAANICSNAMDDILNEMSGKDAALFTSFLNVKNFARFALLWQKYQSKIQYKI
jgi:hypothetical protein